jgi:hypothetical protein
MATTKGKGGAHAANDEQQPTVTTLDSTGLDGPAVQAGAEGAGVHDGINDEHGVALGRTDEQGNSTR